MRQILLLAGFVALLETTISFAAQAGERWPVIPAEIGIRAPPARLVWIPFRCTNGPAYNFYHGAYYARQAPALYRKYAYRPYYRYTAYRIIPRTYLCSN